MMFDWNDQDQVGETIWDELNGSEDHIVPYPKDTEENPVFTFGDCSKKQKNDNANSIAQSTGQRFGAKNEFVGCSLENSSSLNANEECSGQRFDMDAWRDLPSLNTDLNTRKLSLNKSFSSLAGAAVQLDGESELFGNAREVKENDSFLDCDWDNIGNLDDLDKIFRNDSIFGHDMVTNVDEFLSSSAAMIGGTTQSIPMPDTPLSRNQASDQGCSSFQLNEHSSGKRKAADKTADTMENREKAFHQPPHNNQLVENDDRKTKLLKSRKKSEERSKTKALQTPNAHWPQDTSQNHNQQFPPQNVHHFAISLSQAIPSQALAQQSKASDAEPIENFTSSSQFMYSHYGYPAYIFPGIPAGHNLYPDPLSYSNTSHLVPEAQNKSLSIMTPQEKIEKLRRRQQAQAMLAIQQQQQQFSHQVIGAENIEENENKLPSSGLNLLLEQGSSQRISALTDENSLETNIYYQLQDALRQLDIRVRLCVRDSLLRLAKSSVERQNASDKSRTNKTTSDEHEVPAKQEASSGKRHPIILDVETYTNPIDRAVAQLLFHRSLEPVTKPINDGMPQSNVFNTPVSKQPLKIHENASEGNLEGFGEMDVTPSQ